VPVKQPKEQPTKFDLIPDSSIEAMADRFELGRRNYKAQAWNAATKQEKLDDKEWIKSRIEHGYNHLAHYADVLFYGQTDDGDDDGAALMWLGSMLSEAYRRRKATQQDAPPRESR
jgi:hypothetical protein